VRTGSTLKHHLVTAYGIYTGKKCYIVLNAKYWQDFLLNQNVSFKSFFLQKYDKKTRKLIHSTNLSITLFGFFVDLQQPKTCADMWKRT
jgi:hypothetical protein